MHGCGFGEWFVREKKKGKLRRMKANKIYGQHSTVLFRNDNPKIVFYF